MSEQIADREQQRQFDLFVLEGAIKTWDALSDEPDIAEKIIEDVTPREGDDLDFVQQRVNEERRALRELVFGPRWLQMGINDDVSRSLNAAMAYVGEDTVEGQALKTVLHTYKAERNIAPYTHELQDPRRIAFRILNPAKESR